jgi:hypothetical protein
MSPKAKLAVSALVVVALVAIIYTGNLVWLFYYTVPVLVFLAIPFAIFRFLWRAGSRTKGQS